LEKEKGRGHRREQPETICSKQTGVMKGRGAPKEGKRATWDFKKRTLEGFENKSEIGGSETVNSKRQFG